MQIGNLPPTRARFDRRQIATDRISSVQYLKLPVRIEAVKQIRDGVRIFAASTTLTPEQLGALAADVA